MPDPVRWPSIARLWQHVLERPAGAALAGVGVALIVFSMVMYAVSGSATALGFTVSGIVAVPCGALLPRLERARLTGPGVTAEVAFTKLTPQEAAAIELGVVDTVMPENVDEPDEFVAAMRHYTAGEALRSILIPSPGDEVEGVTFRLYLYDEDEERLVPVVLPGFAEGGVEHETWEVGKGATGTAYEKGEFVFVSGDAVWDTTYGLTKEQSERFKTLSVVASVPVTNVAGDTIGVLTASTEAPDGGGLADEQAALQELLARSLLVSRVLIDLLGWYPDEYAAN